MSRRSTERERGLSLIELLLGLAITALVMAPLVPMLATASSAARVADEQISLERDADFALQRIAARIRATPPAMDLQDKPVDDWLKPAVYSVSGAGALVEQQGTQTHVLTEPGSVTRFTLSAPVTEASEPMISISLNMERGSASTSTVTTVRMGSAK